MMANALARYLNKRLLLATLASSGQLDLDALALVFREAKIQDAVVFFDEVSFVIIVRVVEIKL